MLKLEINYISVGGLVLIFLNFDLIDYELTKNTIAYLNDAPKKRLLNEAERWDFNDTGFKNSTKLKEYIYQNAFLNKKEFIKKTSSPSRRTSKETVKKLYTLFKKETPIYIDTEKLYRMMLLSSNLMFTPNEKIYFTIMYDDPYRQWTAEELITEAQKNHFLKLSLSKIKESLDRHIVRNGKTGPLLSYEIQRDKKSYRIHFTNFIEYIRCFEQQ